ncbi:hypothetical protein KC573_04325 [candidate division WWE3 bacterium]|uniref:Uncharacterized protein n=1 Tax=candidate division WWE3 bacterium TaxID=2053526 RepID=A0A955LWW4_UNCKA|nr:hypothetical protein [candidate division WWE3 bacterium]
MEGRAIIDKGLIIKIEDPIVLALLPLIEKSPGKAKEFMDYIAEHLKGSFRWTPFVQKKLVECFNVRRVENTGLLVPMGHDLAKTGKVFITDDQVWFVMSPAESPEDDPYTRYVRAYVGEFGDKTIAMQVLNKIIK